MKIKVQALGKRLKKHVIYQIKQPSSLFLSTKIGPKFWQYNQNLRSREKISLIYKTFYAQLWTMSEIRPRRLLLACCVH